MEERSSWTDCSRTFGCTLDVREMAIGPIRRGEEDPCAGTSATRGCRRSIAVRLSASSRSAASSVHGGDSLVRRVYGHLGDVRHRAEMVEYRVEQHPNILRGRLDELAQRLGTDAGTAGLASSVSD